MQADIILYGKRARGHLLLRALQYYIRALDEGRTSLPTRNTPGYDALTAALGEAEDVETDLVAILNARLPEGNGSTHPGVPGCSHGQRSSPPDEPVPTF